MGFLSNLFKRKKGGTRVGNFIRNTPMGITVRNVKRLF